MQGISLERRRHDGFSLEDIFEDIWEEPGNVGGFIHVFGQCTETRDLSVLLSWATGDG